MEKIVVIIDVDLQDIVPGYIENRKKELKTILDSWEKKDFMALQVIGHKLKGNAGGYGFDHLGIIGGIIEHGAKTMNSTKIEQAIKELEDYLSRLEIIYEEII